MVMKNIIKYFLLLPLCALAMTNCTPDKAEVLDTFTVDVSTLDSVHLMANHTMVVADGKARLEFTPRVITKDGYMVPDYRVQNDWFEYISSNPDFEVGKYFSTKTGVGETIKVKVKIKGTEIESNEFEFTIKPAPETYQMVTFPIVFHVVQTAEDIISYGGYFSADRIRQELKKINQTFAAELSRAPTGANAYMQFKMANYAPDGSKMTEPGIDYLVLDEIKTDNPSDITAYEDLIARTNLLWPPDKYLNIWLIADRMMVKENAGYWLGAKTVPIYSIKGYDAASQPEGLILKAVPANYQHKANDTGVRYRLMDMNSTERQFVPYAAGFPPLFPSRPACTSELIHYLGNFFGLLECSSGSNIAGTNKNSNDFCADTHRYGKSNIYDRDENNSLYKQWPVDPDNDPNGEGNRKYWMSENIMDDQTGLHRSITFDQVKRIRWVIENCAFRQAWKSDFAFTGVETE